MIGHYLLTLTAEQEDRVLTVAFGPVYGDAFLEANYDGCLMCAVNNFRQWGPGCVLDLDETGQVARNRSREPGYVYEDLCERFGGSRVNAAIRNRILSNRARRTLLRARDEYLATDRNYKPGHS